MRTPEELANEFYRKMLVMMGEDPDKPLTVDQTEKGKKQIELFKKLASDFFAGIQKEVIDSNNRANEQ